MAYILHIDTALDSCRVVLSQNREVVKELVVTEAREHAAKLPGLIQELAAIVPLVQLDAINVVAGPGSYTGLRVGLATAKGICYALQKPLILSSLLEIWAHAAFEHNKKANFLCLPMIDARRMEVFAELRTREGEKIMPTGAYEVNEAFWEQIFAFDKPVLVAGNAAKKVFEVKQDTRLHFNIDLPYTAIDITNIGYNAFIYNHFADLAYAEPLYAKEVYIK